MLTAANTIEIKPQAGPQTDFLESDADIAIYGGAAGGGKSFALLLEPLYHVDNPRFGAVIFRRNATQVRNQGGLWDESYGLYHGAGAEPREQPLEWTFPSGMTVKFAHLENEKTVYDWQGSQIALIGYDELTHFSEYQFFYMLSRNRSMSGVPGRVRATCNPDCDSWVRKFIDWWIGDDGYAIKERSGKIRWFIRINETIIWADTKQELIDEYEEENCAPEDKVIPKSVTFIAASVYDNKILMAKDPAYLANLKAMSRIERLRLLGGNWNVRAAAGNFFQREWFPVVDAIPSGWIQVIRFWDRAATRPSETNRDPDWTRGLKLYKYADGRFCIADLKSLRDSPAKVESLIRNTASHDGGGVRIMSQQDPGSAGVSEAHHFVTMLAGFQVKTEVINKDKENRAKPVSSQCEIGNVLVLRAGWNDELFTELENFPDGAHDDIVDVLSGAFNELSGGLSLADVL